MVKRKKEHHIVFSILTAEDFNICSEIDSPATTYLTTDRIVN